MGITRRRFLQISTAAGAIVIANPSLALTEKLAPVVPVPLSSGLLDPVLYLSLHTAAPTGHIADDKEATFAGYERVAVPRTASAWIVQSETGVFIDREVHHQSVVMNAKEIRWPECRGEPESSDVERITHFGIGDAPEKGNLWLYGHLMHPIDIRPGISLMFAPKQLCLDCFDTVFSNAIINNVLMRGV
jgi:hypothetical protein